VSCSCVDKERRAHERAIRPAASHGLGEVRGFGPASPARIAFATMIIGVLGLAGGAAQFVFSAVDLARRGELLRSNGDDSSGRVDRRERSSERAAFQGTLLASAMLMVAALAYLLAHQRYVPYEAGQSAYHRQRHIAQVGVSLAGVAAIGAGFGWLRWSQTRIWRRELLLAVVLLVLAGALIFAFFDLPALTESAPAGEPPAKGLLGTR